MVETEAPKSSEQEKPVPLWTQAFILHFITSFLLAMSLYFILTALPLYVIEELHGDMRSAGLITTFFTLAAVVSRPFLGYLLDTFGRRIVMLVSLFLFACVNFSHVFVASIGTLFVLRILHGLPWGAAQTATSTLAVDLVPEARRGEGLGYFGLNFTFAAALGPFLSFSLLALTNFHTLFIASTVLGAGALVVSFFTRYEDIKNKHARFRISEIIERRILIMALATLLMTTCWGAILSFIALYAKDQHLPGPAWYFTLDAVGTLVSRVKAGQLFDKHGPLWLVTFGFTLLILSFCASCNCDRADYFRAVGVLPGTGFRRKRACISGDGDERGGTGAARRSKRHVVQRIRYRHRAGSVLPRHVGRSHRLPRNVPCGSGHPRHADDDVLLYYHTKVLETHGGECCLDTIA